MFLTTEIYRPLIITTISPASARAQSLCGPGEGRMEISWRSPPPAYSRREEGEGLVTIVLRCPRLSSSSTNLCLAVYLCVTVRPLLYRYVSWGKGNVDEEVWNSSHHGEWHIWRRIFFCLWLMLRIFITFYHAFCRMMFRRPPPVKFRGKLSWIFCNFSISENFCWLNHHPQGGIGICLSSLWVVGHIYVLWYTSEDSLKEQRWGEASGS